MDKIKEISGVLHFIIFDMQGEEITRCSGKNHIVTTGYGAAVEAFAGISGAHIKYVAVGVNGMDSTDSDTEITDSVFVEVQGIEYPDNRTVRFNFSIGYKDAVGMKIREFGLLTADGRLFSRKTREIIEKTEHMTIVGHWDIMI